jgi:predicted protein tyrosine phosphatase
MKEICPRLYVGSEQDFESAVKGQEGWWVVHACKHPYHKRIVGYTTAAAPHGPHYYRIRRPREVMTLNMIDVENPAFIHREELVDPCLDFVREGLTEGNKVLVHCNQGESRAPGLGFLYLITYTDVLPRTTFPEADYAFRALYPSYHPKGGIQGFIRMNWEYYSTKISE